ncbi:hypothetical protein BJ912DRAFT_929549 [Pholiota molesta]|nr:hypothetical protein BJ912DRAFT_929549 [Pholiota molesta]
MDDHRAQTLQALEAFVATQRVLLARQRADIEALQRLKNDLVQRPSQVISHLSEELTDNAFRLSEQADLRLTIPKEIEWSSFQNSDTLPLRAFAQSTTSEITQRSQPFSIQRSSLSDLQKLVKHARRSIVDPILLRFENMSSPEPESDEEVVVDPVERRRELEREKIREHDVDDEAMNMDVSIDDGEETSVPSAPQSQPRPYATKAPPPLSPPSKRNATIKSSSKPKREKGHGKLYGPRKKRREGEEDGEENGEEDNEEDNDGDMPPPKSIKDPRAKRTKPKPETYKQAWSTSEQNLLEQLLEEIPEGERFRWQKISKAMGGRRTPRQVASRVQKYFEKLKKFSLL